MPGARCARSLACKNESSTHASRHGHTGNTRHSPRNGLRLISRSPRGPGSFAPVIPEKLASQELDTSVGVSGPHDFAVRFKRARLASPSASTATRLTSVTIAKRPSVGRDDSLLVLFLPSRQVKFLKFGSRPHRAPPSGAAKTADDDPRYGLRPHVGPAVSLDVRL